MKENIIKNQKRLDSLEELTKQLENDLRFFKDKKYSMYELPAVRDYRDGKVTKQELDALSTCDMNAVINDGLSQQSRNQLKNKTGEEIVDEDIRRQMQ